MQNNIQLVITFCQKEEIESTISLIRQSYHIIDDKIFVLENDSDKNETVLSYNIDIEAEVNPDTIPFNTLSCHRKKQTNTIYTINALNQLIISLNNGVLDKRFNINWEEYKNSVVIIKNRELKIIPVNLLEIKSI